MKVYVAKAEMNQAKNKQKRQGGEEEKETQYK